MTDFVLYWLAWRWMPIRWRIKAENVWYWIIDAPMWQPPDYDVLMTARTKIVIMRPWD